MKQELVTVIANMPNLKNLTAKILKKLFIYPFLLSIFMFKKYPTMNKQIAKDKGGHSRENIEIGSIHELNNSSLTGTREPASGKEN